jgi:hypothetical protein
MVALVVIFNVDKPLECIRDDAVIKKYNLTRGTCIYDDKSCNYLCGRNQSFGSFKDDDVLPLVIAGTHRKGADYYAFCGEGGNPLEPGSGVDCGKDFQLYLRKTFRDRVVAGAEEFKRTTGEDLKINFALRTNKRQAVAWEKRGDKDWLANAFKRLRVLIKGIGPAAEPGLSNHETGLAVDLNSDQLPRAKPILARHQVICGFISNDAIHCVPEELAPGFKPAKGTKNEVRKKGRRK